MNLTILTGSANLPLVQAVAQSLGATLGACDLQRFPDGELHVVLQQSVRGEAARSDVNEKTMVVAPGLGAVKRAARYASLLDRPVAIVHKIRVSGEAVTVTGITEDVRGCAPLIVDDMISTGGTIEAAVKALLAAGCLPDVTVVASHALFVGPAASRFQSLPLHRLIVSDSLVVPSGFPIPTQIVSLSPILANAILRLHRDESLGDLVGLD